MNNGERDELLVQFKLIELRDKQITSSLLGEISSVKMGTEYNPLPAGFDLQRLKRITDAELEREARIYGIKKAGGRHKADTIINAIPFSVKSKQYAPPALVNHTTRPGFELAAQHSGGDIALLDEIIDEYWTLRLANKITEDTSNSHPHSPFRGKKEIIRPFLNHFLFKGTGSGLSKLPANSILAFTDPFNTTTWSIYDESDAIDLYWDKLIFSLRAKKGMPEGYPDHMTPYYGPLKSSIDRWTKFCCGDYRGALHIRSR
jgi:hypothetical protein